MGNIDKVSHTDFHLCSSQTYVVITAFCSLLAIVGFALHGLPFFYDFHMKEFGWSRTVITSGNALGKLLVAPLFGFIAGWIIDRYGPRRMMMAGALMTGADSPWLPLLQPDSKNTMDGILPWHLSGS